MCLISVWIYHILITLLRLDRFKYDILYRRSTIKCSAKETTHWSSLPTPARWDEEAVRYGGNGTVWDWLPAVQVGEARVEAMTRQLRATKDDAAAAEEVSG